MSAPEATLPHELGQLAELVERLSVTNRKLVWELSEVNAQLRAETRHGRQLTNELERERAARTELDRENARLSKLLLDATAQKTEPSNTNDGRAA